jgi:hypothetical protein
MGSLAGRGFSHDINQGRAAPSSRGAVYRDGCACVASPIFRQGKDSSVPPMPKINPAVLAAEGFLSKQPKLFSGQGV